MSAAWDAAAAADEDEDVEELRGELGTAAATMLPGSCKLLAPFVGEAPGLDPGKVLLLLVVVLG